jgi:ribonuclease P protein component
VERARRLRKGREFDSLYSKGTAIGGPLLVLRWLANGQEQTRWGFAAGKRLSKKAVERNRIRRRLREAARTLPVAPAYDIVVIARKGTVEASYGQLQAALEGLLARAGLLECGSRQ